MMHPVEAIGYIHPNSNDQNEEYHKFLKSHEGSQRHNGHTVRGKHIDGAHEEGVRRHPEQRGQFKYILAFGRLAEEDDDESLQQEDLTQLKGTVE